MFGLLQDVRARQPVAPDQTGASGHSQKHQSGRRKSITYCLSDRKPVRLSLKYYYGLSSTMAEVLPSVRIQQTIIFIIDESADYFLDFFLVSI